MKMNEKLDILLNRKRIRRVDFAESVGITYRAFAYYMSDTRMLLFKRNHTNFSTK